MDFNFKQDDNSNFDYDITIVDKKYVLDNIRFNNQDEQLICSSIINNMEKFIFDMVKNGKIASIPYIGTIRKSPIREKFSKHFKSFKIIRKGVDSKTYKNHAKDVYVDIVIEQKKIDEYNRYVKRVRKINKKKYEEIYINFGRASAELFIQSILWLKEVPFDQDVQDMFDKLNNK